MIILNIIFIKIYNLPPLKVTTQAFRLSDTSLNWVITGSGNGLVPNRQQAILGTNAG